MSRSRRLLLSLTAVATIAVISPPPTAVGQGVDGQVDVAGLVVTDLTAPTGVVPGNAPRSVTVTVRNDLPRALPSVRVTLDGVDSGGPQTVSIPARSSQTVTFTTVPCRAGTSTLTATATAADGPTTLSDTGDPATLRVAAGSTCTATVPTAGGTLSLTATAGRVVGLTAVPLSGLPTPPAGLNLPYGAITFRIEDLTPGQAVTVRITVPGPAIDYAKLINGGWTIVPGTVTIPGGVAVTLTDGGVGDADGVADGVIVDPGAVVAPAQATPTTTLPATTIPGTTAPVAPATTAPRAAVAGSGASTPGGALPRTGSNGFTLVWIGLGLTAVGGVLVLTRRRLTRS